MGYLPFVAGILCWGLASPWVGSQYAMLAGGFGFGAAALAFGEVRVNNVGFDGVPARVLGVAFMLSALGRMYFIHEFLTHE